MSILKQSLKESRKFPKTIMIVFGSGGHTTEMLLMIKDLNFINFSKIIFVRSKSDTFSEKKVM